MGYTASTLTASTQHRKGVLVRAPFSLKAALVRETARRGVSLNDVAVGLLAGAFGVDLQTDDRRRALFRARAPSSSSACRRSSKTAIQAEAFRLRVQHERRDLRRARGRARHPARIRTRAGRPAGRPRKGHHTHGRRPTARRTAAPARRTRCASRSSASATAPTRSSRASSTTRTRSRTDDGSRPHARRPRRLPHLGHRVRRRVRRRQGQGRRRPLRGDLGAPERHDQVRRRARRPASRSRAG